MNRKYDILVVGAGVTGLTVAALLAQCKYSNQLRLTVVYAAPRPTYDPEGEVALRVGRWRLLGPDLRDVHHLEVHHELRVLVLEGVIAVR